MKVFTYILALVCWSVTLPIWGQRPALIPEPKSISWGEGTFRLRETETIVLSTDSLRAQAETLRSILGERLSIQTGGQGAIRVEIDPTLLAHEGPETYRLEVTPSRIHLRAGTCHGLHNALQTLRQLVSGSSEIPVVSIQDAPAFSWRGYMVDVGRNYQGMDMLREQIDIMALLKLNVFHFHLTEDVAWRLAIKRYPQLTEAKHMTRDHGLFYSEREMRQLIQYCRERHILFVPEIDMPGHSAAFRSAMGVDMQSEEGLQITLDILSELLDTYGFRYIHIGADEVKITNPEFLPRITQYLESRGVQVLGWHPGGKLGANVWRQLWGREVSPPGDNVRGVRIDSRNLYLNHMDPLESVVHIYNKRILDVERGSKLDLGATLCLWNDRRLRRGEDNLRHNAVYPGMLAFAERAWCGGGQLGQSSAIDAERTALGSFARFETRMMELRKKFLAGLPFPYTPQSDVKWDILGPYPNGGDTSKAFGIERASVAEQASMPADTTLVGGTIIYRHFWAPILRGHFVDLAGDQTFYARRIIYSPEEREADYWISLYHYSTSHQAPPPRSGAWNNLGGAIWLNGERLDPPHWLRADQEGDLEIPLEDENYQIRRPYKLHLRKGANVLLIKTPIASLQSPWWYFPNKWMFTCIEAPDWAL